TLCISMAGITAFWTGILKVAENAGILEQLTGKMKPLFHFLFPSLPEGHPAGKLIATNLIANLLGLGSAATPAGLKAMESLQSLEDDRRAGKMPGPVRNAGIAGNEMCTFLIINISSLQLIPMNMIAYRSQYGSADPAVIVGAGILATAASTGVAVIFCKIMELKRETTPRNR
ncbi:MAG TPA: nucleoside recognition protein, partial [Candidatus Blautia gallistercoris]|nr:nucleoside recognition protein [Candidatus Blautia gallistercoris]